MKKFFKTFSLLIIVLLFVFSLVFNYNVMTATADDSNTDDTSQYIDTRDYDSYQINDVDSLTTKELLEEVMNYPYLLDLLLYNDFNYGLRIVSEKYNGLRELLEREDLYEQLSFFSNYHNLSFSQEILITYLQGVHREIFYVPVTIYTKLHNPVNAEQCISDYSSTTINIMNSFYDDIYLNATLISSASRMYNCHSYAWYNQDTTTNNIWLPYPSSFKTDCYFPQTTWQAGDILVYVENGDDIHSAIIESTDGTLSGTIVISKWGDYGLYRHAANHCPYNTSNVVAYRLCSHSFSVEPYNMILHRQVCSSCSYSNFESHTLNPLTGRCAICGDRCVIIEPNNNESNE